MAIIYLKLFSDAMKTKENVALTIDKDILSFTRKNAERNNRNLSDYVEELLEQNMISHKNKKG
jgi:hypothetical protein